eukprot:jgi/Astpho2/1455/fgenesh1_pg.00025_%23_55_t
MNASVAWETWLHGRACSRNISFARKPQQLVDISHSVAWRGEQAALPMLSVALLQDTNVKNLRPALGLAMGRHNLMVAGLNPDLGALKAQIVVLCSSLTDYGHPAIGWQPPSAEAQLKWRDCRLNRATATGVC